MRVNISLDQEWLGRREEAEAEMEQALRRFGRGLVWLSVAWLSGVCVCVWVMMGTRGGDSVDRACPD